jgi:hypothetical protein
LTRSRAATIFSLLCFEMKREAVAKFIIRLARENESLGVAALHRKAVAAFADPVLTKSLDMA